MVNEILAPNRCAVDSEKQDADQHRHQNDFQLNHVVAPVNWAACPPTAARGIAGVACSPGAVHIPKKCGPVVQSTEILDASAPQTALKSRRCNFGNPGKQAQESSHPCLLRSVRMDATPWECHVGADVDS